MDVVFALGHFCEAEGPSIIFCTQKLHRSTVSKFFEHPTSKRSIGVTENGNDSPEAFKNELDNRNNADSQSLQSSTESLFKADSEDYLCKKVSKGPESPRVNSFHNSYSRNQSPISRKSSCVTCSTVLPLEFSVPDVQPRLYTNSSTNPDVLYMSSQHPHTQQRYSTLKRLMVRCLSCEYSTLSEASDSMSNPLFFGDQDNGYVISQSFSLRDPSARGGLRRYAIIATCPNQLDLILRYSFISEKFLHIVQFLRISSFNTKNDYSSSRSKTTASSSNGTFASPSFNISSLSGSSNIGTAPSYEISSSIGANVSSLAHTQRLPSFSFLRRRDDIGDRKSVV